MSNARVAFESGIGGLAIPMIRESWVGGLAIPMIRAGGDVPAM
jgi:hypothetical protein